MNPHGGPAGGSTGTEMLHHRALLEVCAISNHLPKDLPFEKGMVFV